VRSSADVSRPAPAVSSVPMDDLEEMERREDELMTAIQQDERDVESMRTLAEVYMRRGRYDAAIGPLARAAEVEPGRDDLRYELLLVLRLSERAGETVDVAAAAREFAEMAAMWGHGC
jgi:cytochrome c-type biogenesis protein CcmH/NrfG